MLYRYHPSNIIPEDPASYALPDIEPVHLWNSTRKEIIDVRKKFIRQWILASVQLWIMIFLVSAIYLGTGENPSRYTNNLDVAIVDFDGDLAGSFFLHAFQQSSPGNLTLNWLYKNPSDYDNNVDNARHDIDHGEVWAIVVLRPKTTRLIMDTLSAYINTTMSLTSPFTITPPIFVIYEDGRNPFTVNNYVLPPIRTAIATASARFGQALRNGLISNLSSSSSASASSVNRNLQLLNTFRLGSLLVDPLSAAYQNIHPASPFVGQLATTLGYIYLYLISGIVVGSGIKFASTFVGKIHWADLLVYRMSSGIFQAFIVSLIYSLIVLWFFGIHSGSLFMRYWMFNWLSVLVFGIVVVIFTINLGVLASSLLILFVILMLAGSSLQIALELSNRFYRYGIGLPLYHIINGARHLLFNSYSRFGVDVGVIVIYLVVLFILAIGTSIYALRKQEKKILEENQKTKTYKKGRPTTRH